MNLPLDKNTNYVATYTFVLAYGSACPEGIPCTENTEMSKVIQIS